MSGIGLSITCSTPAGTWSCQPIDSETMRGLGARRQDRAESRGPRTTKDQKLDRMAQDEQDADQFEIFGCGGGKQCRLQGFTLFNPAILPVQL